MGDERHDFQAHNRYAVDECGREGGRPSKALEAAIMSSRKHIEAAFKDSISDGKLGQLKVKVKVAD